MATKEKMVDLKPKVEKVTKEHLAELQEVVNNINAIQFEIGKIEAQKHSYLHKLAGNQDRIKLLQDTMQKEYGTFDIDLKDGTINYAKDEE
mgnify:FL=1|tara:strand:+ start:3923 stop:4195 length:273 start_codon:yes stop_codon:yes gene_type:complete